MAKILVIDDDPDLTSACQTVLESAGYQVQTAENVPSGHAAVGAFKPDLLILDVMMEQPDDGIALAQRLRREKCAIPILMLTSISKVTGMEYGRDSDLVPVDAFQEKPVDPKQLLTLVRSLLSK